MKKYEFDPLANIFPLMEGAEYDALVADVKANGLHEPIWIYAGKILDGRNRYLAYLAAGFTDDISVREYTGDDPAGFVVSMNLKRRHLNESQRAMVAAKLAALRDGQRQVGQLADVPTQEGAARLLNVGERSVRRAKVVRDQGEPELITAVESGTVSVSAAAAVARLPKVQQREAVAGGKKQVAAVAKGEGEADQQHQGGAPAVIAVVERSDAFGAHKVPRRRSDTRISSTPCRRRGGTNSRATSVRRVMWPASLDISSSTSKRRF